MSANGTNHDSRTRGRAPPGLRSERRRKAVPQGRPGAELATQLSEPEEQAPPGLKSERRRSERRGSERRGKAVPQGRPAGERETQRRSYRRKIVPVSGGLNIARRVGSPR